MSQHEFPLPPNLPPAMIRREAAAAYVGLGVRKFDEMVQDGRMPRPHCADRRRLWSVSELHAAAHMLPVDGGEAAEDDDTWEK